MKKFTIAEKTIIIPLIIYKCDWCFILSTLVFFFIPTSEISSIIYSCKTNCIVS